MNCTTCKTKLNPYLIRNADIKDGEMIFELNCPKCRTWNTISAASYLLLKKDWDMPTVNPINNKMPSEMNVIFVSMERCGISWIVRNINQVHEAMFGETIDFKPEISPVIATRERFELPLGWNNVYNVDPEQLLKRGYDRVIIIHRDLETLLKVYNLYLPEDISNDQKTRFFDTARVNYKKVYGKQFNNPDCLWINLDDLNKYTVDTFDTLLDFLNFPEYNRPKILAVKPPGLRNWEAYSSVLKQGHKLTGNLGRIANQYTLRDGLLEYTGETKESKKMVKLEKIAIIGPRIFKGNHLSENLWYAFDHLGYNVNVIPVEDLRVGLPSYMVKLYKEHKLLFPISKTIKYLNEEPELIIVDEPMFIFYNDTHIPVFYAHREFKRPPKLYYPDMAFFWHKGVSRYFKDMFAPYWASNVPRILELPPAVDMSRYPPQEKTIKGISNIAGREVLDFLRKSVELTARALIHETLREHATVKALDIPFIGDEEGKMSDEGYRATLPKCEAIWCIQPSGQYISRRMLEAMACKTVVVLKPENEEHEDVLKDMGLYRGTHYIGIDDLSELEDLHKNFKYEDHLDMVELAYLVIKNNHTFKHRAEFLVEMYKDWKLRDLGVVIK
jgi:hypothetical protein